jgi:hypothetical protein
LAGPILAPGSIIEPGNWGRIIRTMGWRHDLAIREMALENARVLRFPHRPSRLDSVFVFLTADEARNFRSRIQAFGHHILYRVRLADPSAVSHITDNRFSGPQGALHHDWADMYWRDFDPSNTVVPGIDNWATAAANSPGGLICREMLTMSRLIVEERVD